jgi:1-acyl-sn-glycerol-3-phosphate acyltransferase
LLVANHLSYLDIVVLASRCECVFLAKREVAEWPIIGSMARQLGMLFVNRERRADVVEVNRRIAACLDRGITVVLFPEGTSSDGTGVLTFRSSLLEPAARLGRSVTYACLGYSTPNNPTQARTAVCWWGAMTFADHVFYLLGLRACVARVVFGPMPLPAMERKALAVSLHRAVNELHQLLNRGHARREAAQ